jgi:hypothetical protein
MLPLTGMGWRKVSVVKFPWIFSRRIPSAKIPQDLFEKFSPEIFSHSLSSRTALIRVLSLIPSPKIGTP